MTIDERVYGYEPAASQLSKLRADMQMAAKLNLELMEIRRTNEAEIARLNTLIEEMQVVNAMLPEIVVEERDEARAEVARLREALGGMR